MKEYFNCLKCGSLCEVVFKDNDEYSGEEVCEKCGASHEVYLVTELKVSLNEE